MLKSVSVLLGVVSSTSLPIDISVIPPEMNPVLYEACQDFIAQEDSSTSSPLHRTSLAAEEPSAVLGLQSNPCILLSREFMSRVVAIRRDIKGELPCSCTSKAASASTPTHCEPGCSEVMELNLSRYEANMAHIDTPGVIPWSSHLFDLWLKRFDTDFYSIKSLKKPRFSKPFEKALTMVRLFSGEADEHVIWYRLVFSEPMEAAEHFLHLLQVISFRLRFLHVGRSGPTRTLMDTLICNKLTTGGITLSLLTNSDNLMEFGKCRFAPSALTRLTRGIGFSAAESSNYATGLVFRAAADVLDQMVKDAEEEVKTLAVEGGASMRLKAAKDEIMLQQLTAFSSVPIGFMPQLTIKCIREIEDFKSPSSCVELLKQWNAMNQVRFPDSSELPVPCGSGEEADSIAERFGPCYDPAPLINEPFSSALDLMGLVLMKNGARAEHVETMLQSPVVIEAIRRGAESLGLDISRIEADWKTDNQRDLQKGSKYDTMDHQASLYNRQVYEYVERFYATSEALTPASPLFHVQSAYLRLSRRVGIWSSLSHANDEEEAASMISRFFYAVYQLMKISDTLRGPIMDIKPQIDMLMTHRAQLTTSQIDFLDAANEVIDRGLSFFGRLAHLIDGYDELLPFLTRGLTRAFKDYILTSIVEGFQSRAHRLFIGNTFF